MRAQKQPPALNNEGIPFALLSLTPAMHCLYSVGD